MSHVEVMHREIMKTKVVSRVTRGGDNKYDYAREENKKERKIQEHVKCTVKLLKEQELWVKERAKDKSCSFDVYIRKLITQDKKIKTKIKKKNKKL